MESRRRLRSTAIFYELIGWVTVSWALLEMSLDLTNETIMLDGGGSIIQKELPASLNRKVSFFRKACQTIPALAEFREEAERIADVILDLKEKRHDLIHGFAAMCSDDILSHQLQRFRYEGQRLGVRNVSYTHHDLMTLSQEINKLARETTTLGAAIGRKLNPHPGYNFAG